MTAADCLFCGIAAKTVPARVVHEDDALIAFEDIRPQAPVHVIVIPRRHLARVSDLAPAEASLVGQLVVVANQVARRLEIAESGYRLVINCNAHGGQTVYHLHLHLLGGRPMQWPPG
ncbi:MAG: histidine triad nucleotide-binding protein [Candidatus Omnitrophica bacterium]|nr:histidine triad nucleotide-binding protein [Candidatus Omnitrophota bacterium]